MPRKGKKLKLLKPGGLIGSKTANELISFYNAFMDLKIARGNKDELLIGDLAFLLTLKKSEASTGGNSSYRGEYSPDGTTTFGSGPFLFGDIVRVSPTNADSVPLSGTIIPGVYICIQDNPEEGDLPNHPLSTGGETTFWHWLSTWPSEKTDCNSDGTTTDVFVDEQPKDPPA